MTELILEANYADIAEQAAPVDEPSVEMEPLTDSITETAEADMVDVIEQHQTVALPDDGLPSLQNRRWWLTANKPVATDSRSNHRRRLASN